ncbi:MAG: hypothetical protein GWP05_07290 [Anaerolineaceae bacterium]|nr:hypothetical protein [Anaerolineaceae bacterium]
MSHDEKQIGDLTRLGPTARGPVQTLAGKLLGDLGDNLESLTVIGSALTEDFRPGRSDINTVLVVGRRSQALLKQIAAYGKAMGRKHLRAPLLMTAEYIERSRDVFGVEFLDFQLNHLTVLGDDPFAGLTFEKSDLRLQCERELKASLIALRQGYIRSMGNPRRVAELLVGCLGNVLPVVRAMLWLKDVDRSPLAARTLAEASKVFEFEAGRVPSIPDLRQVRKPPADQVDETFEALYSVVDHLSRKVDQLEPQG